MFRKYCRLRSEECRLSTSVEGRERFPIRVRYARELRDNPEDLKTYPDPFNERSTGSSWVKLPISIIPGAHR